MSASITYKVELSLMGKHCWKNSLLVAWSIIILHIQAQFNFSERPSLITLKYIPLPASSPSLSLHSFTSFIILILMTFSDIFLFFRYCFFWYCFLPPLECSSEGSLFLLFTAVSPVLRTNYPHMLVILNNKKLLLFHAYITQPPRLAELSSVLLT